MGLREHGTLGSSVWNPDCNVVRGVKMRDVVAKASREATVLEDNVKLNFLKAELEMERGSRECLRQAKDEVAKVWREATKMALYVAIMLWAAIVALPQNQEPESRWAAIGVIWGTAAALAVAGFFPGLFLGLAALRRLEHAKVAQLLLAPHEGHEVADHPLLHAAVRHERLGSRFRKGIEDSVGDLR